MQVNPIPFCEIRLAVGFIFILRHSFFVPARRLACLFFDLCFYASSLNFVPQCNYASATINGVDGSLTYLDLG